MEDYCCDDVEEIITGELIDTYGGDYTYRDVVACNSCRRVWEIEYGARTSGIRECEELTSVDGKEEYLD